MTKNTIFQEEVYGFLRKSIDNLLDQTFFPFYVQGISLSSDSSKMYRSENVSLPRRTLLCGEIPRSHRLVTQYIVRP